MTLVAPGTFESWLHRAVEHEREARWNVAAVLYRALVILDPTSERTIRGWVRCELAWGHRDRAGRLLAAGARARVAKDPSARVMMLEALALAPIGLEQVAEFVEAVVVHWGVELARPWFSHLFDLLGVRNRRADAHALRVWFSGLTPSCDATSSRHLHEPDLPRTHQLEQGTPPRRMTPKVDDGDFERARTRPRLVQLRASSPPGASSPGASSPSASGRGHRNRTAVYGQQVHSRVLALPRPRQPQAPPRGAEGTRLAFPPVAVGDEP